MKHAFQDDPTPKQLLDGQDFCPFIPVFGAPKVMFEKGKGTELWASDGKRYLDFLSGIAVVSLGHCNPAVSDAIADQARTLMHVSNFFSNPVATEAAMKINTLMRNAGAGDGQVFFCNSGAEANEAAIKIARKFGGRGRHAIVSAYGSFHGRTLGALALTGQPAKHEVFQPMPDGFRYATFGDIASLESVIDPTVSAVMLEPIQGEGGVVPADPAYLQAVQALCKERGLLFMMDEVQTGFCRTGKWFGFEHAGVKPDVVTFAKGIGNGMPVGAIWARKDIAAVMSPGDHGSTYSGTAIATAAVNAVINEMTRLDACSLANAAGDRIRAGLNGATGVDHVRGAGLLLGVALSEGKDANAVAADLLGKGLIVNAVNATTLRLAPPLTVSAAEIDEAVALIKAALA
ncbi:MAG: acetylornithine aminotransferase [Actinomycetota bacterium]|jgi:4-aminobutyrate aminotransferase-like enzyme|nr:acetylornithine/succinylornithine family transaminase [Actinomycetota bacterium]